MIRKIALIWLLLFIGLAGNAQPGKVKIACIGNWVTYGWGLKNLALTSYPSLLQLKLGNGYEVKNFGHNSWYQGESDAESYQQVFPLLVTDRRSQWQKNQSFYYAQLPGINRSPRNYFRDV